MTDAKQCCPNGYSDNPLVEKKGWLWQCPQMAEKGSDFDYERYECKQCGRTTKLDCEEMR